LSTPTLAPIVATTPTPAPRLVPSHFEPARVPPEVAVHGAEDPAGVLRVGSPGKVGVLELGFERRGPRTELVDHYQKAPLQIMRPLYYDESRPDMPYTYLMTTGGGVLQGDRQRTDLRFGPGTSSHTTTQAHTKLYRMEHGYATARLAIDAAEGAYVEYLPDPVIPFTGARFYQRTDVTLDPTATLVLGETLYAGRLSRDERHAYDVYASDLEVTRPDGRPVVVDRMRLVPGHGAGDGGRIGGGRVGGPAVLAGHDVVSTLYVVSPLAPAAVIANRLHEALGATAADGARWGVSTLPDDAGAWVRLLGDDTVAMATALRLAWGTVRELLTGRPAPAIRK
jgi:urease accessory protein